MRIGISVTAEPKSLITLLESKQYDRTGECFHPAWNASYKGTIYSKPESPMFWIPESDAGHHGIIFIWVDTWINNVSTPKGDGTVMIGSEMAPVNNKRTADAAIRALIRVLGQEHMSVLIENGGHKLKVNIQ